MELRIFLDEILGRVDLQYAMFGTSKISKNGLDVDWRAAGFLRFPILGERWWAFNID
jgi:hypothetical protein